MRLDTKVGLVIKLSCAFVVGDVTGLCVIKLCRVIGGVTGFVIKFCGAIGVGDVASGGDLGDLVGDIGFAGKAGFSCDLEVVLEVTGVSLLLLL